MADERMGRSFDRFVLSYFAQALTCALRAFRSGVMAPVILHNGTRWQSLSGFGRDHGYTNSSGGARKELDKHEFPEAEQLYLLGVPCLSKLEPQYRKGEKDVAELGIGCLGSELRGAQLPDTCVLYPISAMEAVVASASKGKARDGAATALPSEGVRKRPAQASPSTMPAAKHTATVDEAGQAMSSTDSPMLLAPAAAIVEPWLMVRALGAGPPRCMSDLYEEPGNSQPACGAFGIVTRGVQTSTSAPVAIKRVALRGGDRAPVLNELALLHGLSHENIIRVIDVFVTKSTGVLVMDFGGLDLRAHLDAATGRLPIAEVCSDSRQILLGVQYLHDNTIIHTDLKTRNILICNSHVRICDLGNAVALSCKVDHAREVVREKGLLVGTLWYRPPEILLGDSAFGTQADLWACGCIFAELSTSQVMFEGKNQFDMLRLIFTQIGTPTSDVYPGVQQLVHWQDSLPKFKAKSLTPFAQGVPPLEDVLRAALQVSPATRPAASKLLDMRFFHMRLATAEEVLQDFKIYDGGRAPFAFQHLRLGDNLLAFLRGESAFHVVSPILKNLARGNEVCNKVERLFYASQAAKGKSLCGEVAKEAAPCRLQALRTAFLAKNKDWLTGALSDIRAQIRAIPDDDPVKRHLNTQAFLEMDVECFFAYIFTQEMVSGLRRDEEHYDGGGSTPVIAVGLGGDRVLEVKTKDKVYSTRLTAGDVYVTAPSAFEHTVIHEGGASNVLHGKAVVVLMRSHVFKSSWSTQMNTPPKPKKLFHLVCGAIAERLRTDLLVLPTLDEVRAVM